MRPFHAARTRTDAPLRASWPRGAGSGRGGACRDRAGPVRCVAARAALGFGRRSRLLGGRAQTCRRRRRRRGAPRRSASLFLEAKEWSSRSSSSRSCSPARVRVSPAPSGASCPGPRLPRVSSVRVELGGDEAGCCVSPLLRRRRVSRSGRSRLATCPDRPPTRASRVWIPRPGFAMFRGDGRSMPPRTTEAGRARIELSSSSCALHFDPSAFG